MAPKPKGLHRRSRTAPRKREHIENALSHAPLVPIEKAQQAAVKLRATHPTLDDDTVALCILHVTTRQSIRQIAKQLGADHSWCYARISRPDVQAFLQQLALTVLGVAASRAISTLQDLAENSVDEAMRHKAATDLLNRAGLGNSTTQTAAGISTSYAFSFAPLPAKGDADGTR